MATAKNRETPPAQGLPHPTLHKTQMDKIIGKYILSIFKLFSGGERGFHHTLCTVGTTLALVVLTIVYLCQPKSRTHHV
jgi:hypothetical protein